ncbi:MAG: ABC transporter permease [Deltaproteobacteria bacterium]|nr:ABC transporter permease [Deltaproteobacteria bacterium]MBN2673225.1 ABC transporter permease [Deltaproteobacteria bacterium]
MKKKSASKKPPGLMSRISGVFKKSSISVWPLFGRDTLADAGQGSRIGKPRGPLETLFLKVGQSGVLLGRTAKLLFSAQCDKGESWRVAYRFANGSFWFVAIAMAFVGMIMVYQSTVQLDRAVGDTTLVGASFFKLLVRVLGPTVIGMLLACRVGAGIAAEIGAMSVTSQLDAMRMCAAEPIETLMVPRLRGGIVASMSLVVIGCASSLFAGMVTGIVWFSMSHTTYLNFSLVAPSDLIQGVVKAFSYGVAVPIVSGACGLSAHGGARGVGQATTDAVVGSSFVIVVMDSLISMISHLLVGQ